MLAGTGAPRRVRLGGERRMPVSGTLFTLDDGLIGMVLDAGAHEALALLAEEQSALRRVATLVAAAPEPEAVFKAVAEEAGRLLHARSAATIRYEGESGVDRRALGRRATPGGFVVGTSVPLADSDGLTAIVARTGAARADRGLQRRPRARRRADARRTATARRSPRRSWRAGGRGGSCWSPPWARSATDAEHRLAGFAELVALALESAEARAELNASRVRILEAGRDRAPPAGAQPARRRAAAARRARRAAARAREAARRPGAAAPLLRGAARELEQALAELRELARGLHPAVLADRGLAPALETLASRSPLPVSVEGVPEERLAEPRRGRRLLRRRREPDERGQARGRVRAARADGAGDGELQVEIADDGRGGADPGAGNGTGLRGLADRVEALGGRLAVESPPGAGTIVRAVLPLT